MGAQEMRRKTGSYRRALKNRSSRQERVKNMKMTTSMVVVKMDEAMRLCSRPQRVFHRKNNNNTSGIATPLKPG
jgi:hypothetical protein